MMLRTKTIRVGFFSIALGFLTAAAPVVGQQPPAPSASGGGWRRITDAPAPQAEPPSQSNPANAPEAAQEAPPPDQQAPQPPADTFPSMLTIRPGTFITVRINGWLSSDRSEVGDAFAASLERPLVVDGIVVAQRGQTVGGRVVEARKAGRVEGVSRLGIQLTDLTLVDGQTMPMQTQLINRNGGTSEGRDAAGIAATTGIGAAAGAAGGGGVGAAIGAGAGAIVGTIGVLLTRGHDTVIYPESVLTFRLEAPVNISTTRSSQAFRYVDPQDYERAANDQNRPRLRQAGPGYGYPAPAPYYSGPAYYPYPYWYGSGFSFFVGPRFYYGRPHYYGRYGRRW